jgi:hypothetical protein|tara:strand:- start:473 stop:1003 length:531 start_codon:yes stop_codon:yes gene_type:complete
MYKVAVGGRSFNDIYNHREAFIFDMNLTSCVFCRSCSIGNNYRDSVACVPNYFWGNSRVRRFLQVFDAVDAGQGSEHVLKIHSGIHRYNTGHILGPHGINGHNARMGLWAPDERYVGHVWKDDIIRIRGLSSDKSRILFPADRSPNELRCSGGSHGDPSVFRIVAAADRTALTMFW